MLKNNSSQYVASRSLCNIETNKGPFRITTYSGKQFLTGNSIQSDRPHVHDSLRGQEGAFTTDSVFRPPYLSSSFPLPSFPFSLSNFFVFNSDVGRFSFGGSPFLPPRTSVMPLIPFHDSLSLAPRFSAQQTEFNGKLNVSISSNQISSNGRGMLNGKAYISRNVYKSIVRFLYVCVQKNKEDITQILKEAGFSGDEIEKCFIKLKDYNDSVKAQNSKKNSQAVVRKLAKERSSRTYVLRETLYAMVQNSKNGRLGRISERNKRIYNDVCEYYYNEIVKSIGKSSQSKSFIL